VSKPTSMHEAATEAAAECHHVRMHSVTEIAPVASVIPPPGQAAHAVCICAGLYVFMGHSIGATLPVPEQYTPSRHELQVVAPSSAWYMPAEHGTGWTRPLPGQECPLYTTGISRRVEITTTHVPGTHSRK
jgi:hypothetical protein